MDDVCQFQLSGIKVQVREWWNERPCGTRISDKEIGSEAFFEEIEQHRYKQEYHIPKVVNFEDWKEKEILEIGCGLGTDLLQFARAGARVTGIDLTPRSVELTSRRFELYGFKGHFEVGDAENLRFTNDTFDLVYSHGVLHHSPDTLKAIDEVYRVLKPRGKTIIMLYHKNSYNYWVNIRIVRGITFALIRRGFPVEILSKFMGIKVNLLREYQKVIEGKSEWTVQDLLNNNTDGPGNPLSKVFTRAEVKRMFSRFESVETKVYWLVKKNIPFIGKYIPRPVDYLLGRLMGWALYITAVK